MHCITVSYLIKNVTKSKYAISIIILTLLLRKRAVRIVLTSIDVKLKDYFTNIPEY